MKLEQLLDSKTKNELKAIVPAHRNRKPWKFRAAQKPAVAPAAAATPGAVPADGVDPEAIARKCRNVRNRLEDGQSFMKLFPEQRSVLFLAESKATLNAYKGLELLLRHPTQLGLTRASAPERYKPVIMEVFERARELAALGEKTLDALAAAAYQVIGLGYRTSFPEDKFEKAVKDAVCFHAPDSK